MIDDPVLNCFALGLLVFVGIVLFYGIITIHDIPYLISKKRDHPHPDAIGGMQDFRDGEGRALARIKLTSDLSEYQLPLGSAAQVAILTHYFHHIALLRRILLRMTSWQNYVFMEPHGGGGVGH